MCDKIFKTQEYLHQHKKTVHIGQDISCDQCEEPFAKTTNLNRHKISVHGNIKDYCCKICGQKFPRPDAVKVHYKRCKEKQAKAKEKSTKKESETMKSMISLMISQLHIRVIMRNLCLEF